MDKYLKKPEISKDHSANVSAADRATQYKKSEVFEDGGKLFCRSCIRLCNTKPKKVRIIQRSLSSTICKQITTPTPDHSIFTGRMLFLTPNQQCQSTEGTEADIKRMKKSQTLESMIC